MCQHLLFTRCAIISLTLTIKFNIIQGSGSAHDSHLQEGHIIVEVNGRSLFGLEHNECAKLIADCFKERTELDYMEFLVLDTDSGKYLTS